MVKIAQLASLAGPPSRVAQPETPVTLQFQGNKFTLSHSQLRQLTAGQPLQLQGERHTGLPGNAPGSLARRAGDGGDLCSWLPSPDTGSGDGSHLKHLPCARPIWLSG